MVTLEIDKELVAIIRRRFQDEYPPEASADYDGRDIERIQTNDSFIWRFVDDQSRTTPRTDAELELTVSTTIRSLATCLKWRKERAVNDLKASDFPREVVGSGRVRVGWDANGNFMVVDRIGLFRKNAEWNSLLSDIVAYDMERYGLPVNGSLYLDVTGAGYSSMDLQNAMSISELLTKYYPNTFSKVFMYGVPALVKPFLGLVLGLLPEKHSSRVQIIDKATALEQINGLKVGMPEGCSTLEEVGLKRGISRKAIDKEIKQQKWIKEQCDKDSSN